MISYKNPYILCYSTEISLTCMVMHIINKSYLTNFGLCLCNYCQFQILFGNISQTNEPELLIYGT